MCHPEQKRVLYLILAVSIDLNSMNKFFKIFDSPFFVLMEGLAHGLNEGVKFIEVEFG